jgi:TfoX/Sxy family transcriptional regulator of competence genes
MAFDEQLAGRVRRGFEQKAITFEEKRMMGGLCFLVDGKMCLGVEKNKLMARVGPGAYDAALAQKGCRPMDFTGRPMRGFVFVEPEGLDSDLELEFWLDLAVKYNPIAEKSGGKRRAKKRTTSR